MNKIIPTITNVITEKRILNLFGYQKFSSFI
jgi:hypothetical protein